MADLTTLTDGLACGQPKCPCGKTLRNGRGNHKASAQSTIDGLGISGDKFEDVKHKQPIFVWMLQGDKNYGSDSWEAFGLTGNVVFRVYNYGSIQSDGHYCPDNKRHKTAPKQAYHPPETPESTKTKLGLRPQQPRTNDVRYTSGHHQEGPRKLFRNLRCSAHQKHSAPQCQYDTCNLA